MHNYVVLSGYREAVDTRFLMNSCCIFSDKITYYRMGQSGSPVYETHSGEHDVLAIARELHPTSFHKNSVRSNPVAEVRDEPGNRDRKEE